LPPKETKEAEVTNIAIISAEHSYASVMTEQPKKQSSSRGATPSRNSTRNTRGRPLVGKVLPFRHQQSNSNLQQPSKALETWHRGSLCSPRVKEDFAKSHTVNISDTSLKVTCHWEAEYLFHLDSRYTTNAMEKTVVRALHGPWDLALHDDTKEILLIFHMWVALFYKMSNRHLRSIRKVVEYSNPKKYVLINTTRLSDDDDD
ncbi:Protein FAM208B, partial [Acanthisitta chloris]